MLGAILLLATVLALALILPLLVELRASHEPAAQADPWPADELVFAAARLAQALNLVDHAASTAVQGDARVLIEDALQSLESELRRMPDAERFPYSDFLPSLISTAARIRAAVELALADRSAIPAWREAGDLTMRFGLAAERLARRLRIDQQAHMAQGRALTERLESVILTYLALLVPLAVAQLLLVSASRRREQALRAESELLTQAFDHLPSALAVFDASDRLQYANGAYRQLYFRSCPDQVRPGCRFDELIDLYEGYGYRHPDESERLHWLRLTMDVQRHGGSMEEYIGGGRSVLVTKYRLGDGRLVCNFTEITQIKHIERQLRDNQHRLELVLSATRDGIWDWDLETGWQNFSDSWFRMIGLDHRPPDYDWRGGVHGEDLPAVEDAIQAHLDDPSRPFRGSYRYRHKDGYYLWIEARGRCESGADGRPARFVGALSDISRRRRMEIELALYRDNLEQEVRRRTLQLESAMHELEALSYTISHDLRAPLRAVDGFAAILLEDYAGRLDERGRDYLQRLRRGSQTMGQLIDDLLALTRIFSQKFETGPVDLSAIAQAVVLRLREADPAREVTVEIEPGMTVLGDSAMLAILMEKLIGNAWHFTVDRAAARITVGSLARERRTVYHVSDNGIGFDMAYYDQLFGAFRKLHSGAGFAGSGVGLAAAARIVKRHKGRIWADGRPGEGASFYFTLGLKSSAVAQYRPDVPPGPPPDDE